MTQAIPDTTAIDGLIAAALRGETATWPFGWVEAETRGLVLDRILYHGVAGLIADRSRTLPDWPGEVIDPVHEQGIALAMWELSHKVELTRLLTALADAGVVALLLKGSALAYDLYPNPATRARGDSDVLVAPGNLDGVRAILAKLGFVRQSPDQAVADDLALQEVWSIASGGFQHHIDLHWQLLNAPSLCGVLGFEDCCAEPNLLPRLAPTAIAMSRVLTLLHTTVHRAMHLTAPYFVDGVTYYGGDRLIWTKDIDLLARALSVSEWSRLSFLAERQQVAAVCLNGLRAARACLGTVIPEEVERDLGAARGEPASNYLLGSRQARRAWQDVLAIPGWRRKLAYAAQRALPSGAFLRAKYPQLSRQPVVLLHLRRLIELVRPRRSSTRG
jgi:hypothetical protein